MTQQQTTVYIETGRKTIMGTDFPIYNTVERDGRRWLVTWNLCNGIPSSATYYRTKREAMDAAQFIIR